MLDSPTPNPATTNGVGPHHESPSPSPAQTPSPISTASSYSFPHSKLKRRISRPDKTPLVLVACGSFSPITVLHLQMSEMAEHYVKRNPDCGFEVVGSYLSPVSDAYQKPSLAPAHHRIMMCELAVEKSDSHKLMVDPWETLRYNEAGEPVYTRTVDVLHHIDHEINDVLGGIQAPDGSYKRARVVLLIGADVAMTLSDPKSWSPADLDVILGTYGAFIVERPTQCDIQDAVKPLRQYDRNIWTVNSFDNDVSSTKIRAQLENGERAWDLPKSVYEYIMQHDLYQNGFNAKAKATTNGTTNSATAVDSTVLSN